MSRQPTGRFIIAVLALSAGVPASTRADNGTWSGVATGAWSTGANWTGGIIANGADFTATFANDHVSPITVTLDSSRTIGSLIFGNPNASNAGWTIGGSSTLTFSNSSAGGPTINVNKAGVSATLSVQLAGSQGFTKTGPGILSLTDINNMTGGITVSDGILSITRTATVNPLGNNAVNLNGGTLRLGFVSISPFATTGGYNQDVIRAVADPTTPPYGTTAAVDNGLWVYYENGIAGAPATGGLPGGDRTFVSSQNPNVTFQLQGYGSTAGNNNNSIRLATAGDNGTVSLVTPQRFQTLAIAHSSGESSTTFSVLFTFSDSSTALYDNGGTNYASADWFNGTPFALSSLNRFNITTGAFQNAGTNPRLYETDITLTPGDQLKTVTSIQINKTGGTGFLNVFGFSGSGGAPVAQNFGNAVNVTANSTIVVNSPDLAASLGDVSINSSTLNVTGTVGSTLTVGGINLTGDATFNTGVGLTVVPGALSDGGIARTFTKSGPGTINLVTPSPTLTAGATIAIAGGVLNLNNSAALGPSTNVAVNGGVLQLGVGVAPSVRNLSGGGGAINLNSNVLTIDTPNGQSSTYTGVIADGSGPGSLVKAGLGAQTLNGAGLYNGGTNVNAGNLIAAPGTLGSGAIALATGSTLTVSPGPTNFTGFGGTGSNMAVNGVATVAANVLTLTPAAGGQTSSAYFTQKIGSGNFTTSFTYTASNGSGSPADGFTFTVQNDSRGPLALGGGGGDLGYTGTTPSAAVAVNIFDSATQDRGIKFLTNGAAPNIGPYTSVAPVALYTPAFNPIDFTLTYDATAQTLMIHLVQQTTTNVFDVVLPGIDLPSIVGPNGYIGFTGGTGGEFAGQTISNFVFNGQANTIYSNDVNVAMAVDTTIAVSPSVGSPTISMANLNMGAGSTLNVAPAAGTPTNLPYGLKFGETSLNGAATFNVSNNGTGTGSLILGNVSAFGTSSIIKTGTGTLVLTGLTTGLGNGIQVNGGTLSVATGANTGIGSVVVNIGGRISGTGTVSGPLTINNGATIAPGSSVGTLIVNGITAFKSGGKLEFEHNVSTFSPAPTTAADFLDGNFGGRLDLSALSNTARFSIQLVPVNDGPSAGTPVIYTVGTFSDGVMLPSGFTGTDLTPLFDVSGPFIGAFPVVTLSGQSVLLTFTPVPEPANVMLVCVATTAVLGWWRRRNKLASHSPI